MVRQPQHPSHDHGHAHDFQRRSGECLPPSNLEQLGQKPALGLPHSAALEGLNVIPSHRLDPADDPVSPMVPTQVVVEHTGARMIDIASGGDE